MKTEIKKALLNKYFICVCIYGTLLSLLHCYQKITAYNSALKSLIHYNSTSVIQSNPYAPITNVFTVWIGFDTANTLAKIFFLTFPLAAAIPYCWSYCSDRKSGYADKAIYEVGKYNYHLNKYIAVFISSGLTIVIPLLVNFLIMLLFVPAICPDSVYDIYYGIFSNNFMAEIFYGMPILYVGIFILLNFVFCGLFGCFGYAVSTIIKSRIIAIISPLSVLLLIEYIKDSIVKNNPLNNTEFSPLSFLCPAKSFTSNRLIIITEIIVLFLFTFSVSVFRFKRSNKKEAYNVYHDQRYFYET